MCSSPSSLPPSLPVSLPILIFQSVTLPLSLSQLEFELGAIFQCYLSGREEGEQGKVWLAEHTEQDKQQDAI